MLRQHPFKVEEALWAILWSGFGLILYYGVPVKEGRVPVKVGLIAFIIASFLTLMLLKASDILEKREGK